MDDLVREFSDQFRRLSRVKEMSKSQKSLTKDDRCRLCLCWRPNSNNSIEATDPMHQTFTQKLFKIFNLQIVAGGMLPSRVCLPCVNATDDFYRYFVRVLNAQDILQNELKQKTAENVLNEDKTNIVKIEQEVIIENEFSDYLVKVETDPVSKHKVMVIDPQTSLETFDKEPNKSSQLEISISDNNSNHDAESMSDAASLDIEVPPTAVDSPFVRSEPKFTPIELFDNWKLVMKGKELSDELRKIYDLRCDVCYHHPEFDSLEDYFNHYKHVHDTKGFVTCCGKKFTLKGSLIFHLAKHVQPSAFGCPVCKKFLCRPSAFRSHLKTHLPDNKKEEKHVICDVCNKKLANKASLKIHFETFHYNKKEPCSMCDKVFDHKYTLNSHISLQHKGLQYSCHICGKSLCSPQGLKHHLITHDENAKICCKECGFIAKNKQSLNSHYANMHSTKVFKCDKCPHISKWKDNLRNHIRSKHSNLSKYQCSLCEKKFPFKSLLKAHINNHTGERKFTCKYCPKTFVNNGNKFSHMKRMHKDQILEDKQKQEQMVKAMLEKQLLEEKKEQIKKQELLTHAVQAKKIYLDAVGTQKKK